MYGEIVATGELTTDAAGRATLSLRPSDLLPRGDGNRPRYWDEADITYDYTLEVYALSEGWEGAKGQTRFRIAPSVWQATLRPETEFGEKGRVYRYTVRLTDRRTGQPVQAALRWQAGKQLFAGERVRTEILAEGTVQTNAQGVAEPSSRLKSAATGRCASPPATPTATPSPRATSSGFGTTITSRGGGGAAATRTPSKPA